jgi:hypothetical protein
MISMKARSKMILFTLATTLLLSIASAPSASAEITLPQFSTETGFKGESGTTTFETLRGTVVTCKKSTAEGTARSVRSGTLHIDERECSSSGIKCTSLGDAEGTILISGEWQLVDEDGLTMLLMTLEEVHFTCGGLVLIRLRGSLLEPITPVDGESTTKFTLELKESRGEQEYTEYDNDEFKAVSAKLLASTNGGEFEAVGAEAKESTITTEKQDVVISVDIVFRAGNERIRHPRDPNHRTVTVISTRLDLVNGTAFRVLNDCLNRTRPTCEFEWESGASPVRGSVSEFLVEYEYSNRRRTRVIFRLVF